VAVARARQSGDPHQADDELVAGDLRRSVGQALELGPEPRARHIVEEIRMDPLHRVAEVDDLALDRRRRGHLLATRAPGEQQNDHRTEHTHRFE
jgi:hypothetical protein